MEAGREHSLEGFAFFGEKTWKGGRVDTAVAYFAAKKTENSLDAKCQQGGGAGGAEPCLAA